jgi:hypothetical protein
MTLPSCDCISRQNKHQPIVGTGSQLPPKPPSESRGQEIIVTRRDEDRDPAALPTVTQKVQGKPGPTNFSAPSDFHTLITHTHTQQSLTLVTHTNFSTQKNLRHSRNKTSGVLSDGHPKKSTCVSERGTHGRFPGSGCTDVWRVSANQNISH